MTNRPFMGRVALAAILLLTACSTPNTTVSVQPIQAQGELDAFNAIKTGPRVILELKDGYDARGTFTLAAQYASLTALATHLEAQDPNYTWTVSTPGILVGRPSTGSLLDRPLGSAVSFSHLDLCSAFKTIVHTALPTTPGVSGCRSRDPGVAVAEATVSADGSQKVAEVLALVLDGLPAPTSLLIYSPGAGLRPVVAPVW